MTRRAAFVLALTLAVTAVTFYAWRAQPVPTRPRYVLVNETGQHDFDLALRMSLKLAEDKAGIENALVLVPALPADKTIEELAAELFSKYRIGQRQGGRGLLYLYSARENLMKIEVSYALEGAIPDLVCRQLEEAAKTYMLSEVPQDFLSELIITTNLRGIGSVGDSGAAARPSWLSDEFLSGGAGALVHGYGKPLSDYERAIKRLPAADLSAFGASREAPETLQRYLQSLQLGIGDPRLPLLTDGSRIFRAVVPRDDAQLRRIHRFLQAAAPLQLLYSANLALAVPAPGGSNLPIVLRRGTDRLWYVDEPKAWTYFHRFENSVDFRVKYADNPFLEPLRKRAPPSIYTPIYGRHVATPEPPAYPFDLARRVEELQAQAADRPRDPVIRAALGDLYLFEMNWISKAIEWYEQAKALTPDEPAYRWRLMDLYLNDSRADKCLAELKFLADQSPKDIATRDWYAAYKKAYDSVL